MPSPEDKLTVTQIMKETGLERRTITNWAEMGYMKKYGMVREFLRLTGRPPMKSDSRNVCRRRRNPRKGSLVRTYRWGDVKALVDRYQPGGTSTEAMQALMPAGHITASEAAYRLCLNLQYVRASIRNGGIRGAKIRMNGVCERYYLFAEEAHVAEIIAERGHDRRLGRDLMKAESRINRPLISADNALCLWARQELWASKGRKFRNCVDLARKCG